MGNSERRQPFGCLSNQAGRNTPSVTWITPFEVMTSALTTVVLPPLASVNHDIAAFDRRAQACARHGVEGGSAAIVVDPLDQVTRSHLARGRTW